MVTIKEIAKRAGVSTATVSNVINGNNARVSEETAKRVMEIVDEFDYHPNMVARGLIAKHTKIIAVLLPIRFDDDTNLLEDTYNQQIVGLIEAELNRKGYFTMLRSFSSADDLRAFFRNWNIDGAVMFYPFFEDKFMQEILDYGKPIVVLDRFYQNLNTLCVDVDDYGGGYIAARHFIENGHTNLGFSGPFIIDTDVINNRLNGFKAGLAESGLTLPKENIFPSLTPYSYGVKTGRKIAKAKNRPTAIFCTMDTLAIGVMEGLRSCGVSVPEEVSVIGFDNWMGCEIVSPKLTTIAQSFSDKIRITAEILIRAIEEPEKSKAHHTINVELIERESVACLNNKLN